jgi:hypothetical protein
VGKMLLDEHHLSGPALVVHGERLGAAREGYAVEAGFADREQGAARILLEFEDDERRRLARVIYSRVDGEGVPAKRDSAAQARCDRPWRS